MSLAAALEQAKLDQFVRHARAFGTECVYETAVQDGLSRANLARLRIELDELDAGRKSRLGWVRAEGDSRQARHLRPHGQGLPEGVRSDGL
jgi:hypothetical protein